MCDRCPYCGEEYRTVTGLYTHVLDEHSEAVLSKWIDEYGFPPRLSGQTTLQGVSV